MRLTLAIRKLAESLIVLVATGIAFSSSPSRGFCLMRFGGLETLSSSVLGDLRSGSAVAQLPFAEAVR